MLGNLTRAGIICLVFVLHSAAVRAQAAIDGFDPNANGAILAVAVQPDGKILIGGDFTSVSPNGGAVVMRNRIARLNTDGTLDTGFDPSADQLVATIAVQSDGKILIGGIFTSVGGQTRNNIARLDATTGAPDSFDPNANSDVYTIAVQADNKILIGGAFTTLLPNGGAAVPRMGIARLETSGAVDSAFDPRANNSVFSIAVQTDSRILIGGAFNTLSPNGGAAITRNRIARLETGGTVDISFNPNADNSIFSIALQADGKIFIGGAFNTLGAAATRRRIARLNINGTADSFNPDADSDVYSIAVQANGRILAGGLFSSIGGTGRNFVAQLDAVTGLADSFNPDANGAVNAVAVQQGGKILVGGDFTDVGGVTRNSIARFGTGTTAASVSISGRVMNGNGRGIARVGIYLTGHGGIRSALTNPFGYYKFDQVDAGETYVLEAQHKRYLFAPRVVTVTDEITGVDFFAGP